MSSRTSVTYAPCWTKSGMGQANAVVTPGSKEATTAQQQLDQTCVHVRPPRQPLVSWIVPVFERQEARYHLRKVRSDARRFKPNVGWSAQVTRIARYLKGRPGGLLSFLLFHKERTYFEISGGHRRGRMSEDEMLNVRCGTEDWRYPLRHWSVTQATMSLSAVEAEATSVTMEPRKVSTLWLKDIQVEEHWSSGHLTRAREQSHNDVGLEDERRILRYRQCGYNTCQNKTFSKYIHSRR